MKLLIFLLFLFLSLFRAQADVIDSLMTHSRDSIALTSDSLVLRFLSESGIPISDNNKVRLLKSGPRKFIEFIQLPPRRQTPHSSGILNFLQWLYSQCAFRSAGRKGERRRGSTGHVWSLSATGRTINRSRRDITKNTGAGNEIVKSTRSTFPYINHAAHRDHRKIAVIDGEVAYTGGMNIADYYINGLPKIGTWRDMHMRIEGDARQWPARNISYHMEQGD